MPDARFFESAPALSLTAVAELTGAVIARGDPATLIETAAPLVHADARGVAFLADPRYRADLAETRAGAVFVAPAQADLAPSSAACLVTPTPQVAWARIAHRLHPPRRLDTTNHAGEAALEADVVLGPGAVLGPGVAIGRGSRIGANTVIGPGVQIGRDCEIGPNVSLGFCLIGDRVRIAASSVIGAAGFGVAGSAEGLVDVPQLGRVILQDDVSVGANSCIDRGAWEDTIVGEGSKIDNLVQVGHNCRLGRHVILAGHTGLSGSVVIGDGAKLGGRAGVTDHLSVGKGARIAAAAMVINDVPAGETWGGAPARPMRRFLRETLWLAKQASGRKGNVDE